jgi:hypothetical protein
MSKRREQLSVPLDPELREFVERTAEREDRSVAGQIRHLVAEAARADQIKRAASGSTLRNFGDISNALELIANPKACRQRLESSRRR